jgi:hypothetical protein
MPRCPNGTRKNKQGVCVKSEKIENKNVVQMEVEKTNKAFV